MAKNSRDYWKEREEEARKHTIQDEEVYDREIKRIYQRMYDNINREVNGFFVRYAGREGISISEAKKRVSKLDMAEYSRKAKEYVKNKNFSRQANEEMRIYNLTMKVNRLEMLKAHMGLEMVNSYQDLEDYMGRALNETTMKELERQAGILGDSVSNPQRFAKQIVDGSFHHAKWSDRIWSNQQTLKMKLYDNLQVGLIQGRNPNVLARDIMKTMGASVNDASRLMRTEMCRAQTDAQMATLAANGFEDYEFIAERSSRTCDQCLAMDGKHFKIKDAMPGENAPPLHPNCRCGTAAWMDDKAYEEWLDSGAAADGVSFKDFSANYKAAGETGLGFEEWKQKSNDLTERRKQRMAERNKSNEPSTSELQFDEHVSKKQRELIEKLYNQYNSRLQRVEPGAEKAAGDVDISGQRMRLSSKHESTAIHEFAHTLANSNADKYGLTNDQDFWKEIRKTRREYMKDVEGDPSRWISTYEHSGRSVDEFMAEAFTHAKMRELGLTIPKKYGNDFKHSKKVLSIIDKYFGKRKNR